MIAPSVVSRNLPSHFRIFAEQPQPRAAGLSSFNASLTLALGIVKERFARGTRPGNGGQEPAAATPQPQQFSFQRDFESRFVACCIFRTSFDEGTQLARRVCIYTPRTFAVERIFSNEDQKSGYRLVGSFSDSKRNWLASWRR